MCIVRGCFIIKYDICYIFDRNMIVRRKLMNRPNALLKVVSILYIIFSSISIVVIVMGSLGIGALLGGLAGNVGAGLSVAFVFAAISLIGAILGLVAGISGVKAKNLKICKILAIILIVLAAISFINNLVGGKNILSALIGIVLPVLYTIGVFKEPDV